MQIKVNVQPFIVRLSALIALSCIWCSAHAQTNQYDEAWRWTRFTTESALPADTIYEIYESSDSAVWVSTPSGLAVFDGFRWSAIGNDRYTIDGDIRGRVLVRKQDSLFIVTKEGGIHYLSDEISKAVPLSSDSIFVFKKSKLFFCSLTGTETLNYREINAPAGMNALHGSSSGVFAEAANTLYRLSHGTWQPMLSSPAGELMIGIGSGGTAQLLENSAGAGVLCVLRPHQVQGVWEWSGKNPLRLAGSEKPEYLRAMAIGPQGQVIAVYRSDDVRLRSKGVWRTMNLESLGITDILSVCFLANGDVCVGTKEGLYQYTVSPSRWIPFRNAVPDFTKKLNLNFPKGRACFGDLLEASNGKLYALVARGGSSDLGALIEYDRLTNTYTNKIDLNPAIGSHPYGSLMQASDGKIYGMTWTGGASNLGVIFRYDISTNTYSTMADFNGLNGANPHYCRLIEIERLAPNRVGFLWGMTNKGGVNDMGTLFSFDPVTSTITKRVDFSFVLGSFPGSSLMRASNGKLYGMTSKGGANDMGVIFEYDIENNAYRKKIDLSAANGSFPNGSLMQASNGLLYGMTYSGGANNAGVIFEYDISSNTYTKKYDFDPVTGSNPTGTLLQTSNGLLYGMTVVGGVSDLGTIFEFNISTNTYTKGADFQNDGYYPSGSLIEVGTGKLYGTTYGGNGTGMIFEYDINTTNPRKSVNEIHLAKDGTLWIATGNGLEIRYADGTSGYIDRIDSVKLGTVTGLGEDNNGNIWISSGFAFSGVFCWDGKEWKHVTIGDIPSNVVVHKIRKDKNGDLWFLGMLMKPRLNNENQPGAFLLRDGKFIGWGQHEGLSGGRVYAFAEGSDGSRWFGTTGGISRWSPGLEKKGNPGTGVWSHWKDTITFQGDNATIHAMALDRSNSLWFAARGKNHILGYIDVNDSVRFVSAPELVYKYLFDLRVDDEGLLWLATDAGLYQYQDSHFLKFDKSSGLRNNELFTILSTHHIIYLSTHDNGVVGLDKSIPLSPPPRIVIEKPVVEDRHAQIRWTAYTYKGEVPPPNVFSRYSLNGITWSEWEKKSNISFNDLEPGTYTLRVQSRGLYQQYDSAGVRTSFTILPPLYLRPGVLVPIGVLVGSIIILGVLTVIRKRKYVADLQQSESKFRAATENTSSAIFIYRDARILFVNHGAMILTGYTEHEIRGMAFRELIHPEDYSLFKELDKGKDSVNPKRVELRMIANEGRECWVDMTVGLIHYQEIHASLVTAFDITERKDAEEKLISKQKQLRYMATELSLTEERERRRMATYLHDVIGQTLLLSKMKLRDVLRKPELDGLVEPLNEVRDLIDQSIKDTRSLTFDLCPPILYELRFEAAIKSLAEQMLDQHKIDMKFEDDNAPKPLSMESRVVLFHSLKEVLHNIIKHAEADLVKICVSRENDMTVLVVVDNGKGIGSNDISMRSIKDQGFGLFNVRERLSQLGGSLEVASNDGAGTRAILRAPVDLSV